jgi:hypothetical protein
MNATQTLFCWFEGCQGVLAYPDCTATPLLGRATRAGMNMFYRNRLNAAVKSLYHSPLCFRMRA